MSPINIFTSPINIYYQSDIYIYYQSRIPEGAERVFRLMRCSVWEVWICSYKGKRKRKRDKINQIDQRDMP